MYDKQANLKGVVEQLYDQIFEKTGFTFDDTISQFVILDKFEKKKEELGLIPLILLLFTSLTILIVLISWFKIFSKAGQAGWKALVPFFNIFIYTKIVNKPIWWFIIYLIIPIGYILSAFEVSKFFGKNLIFSIGLILFPIVFFPLLAFGKAEFINE